MHAPSTLSADAQPPLVSRAQSEPSAAAPSTTTPAAEPPRGGKGLSVVVDLVEELGADGYLYGHADINGKRTDVVARVDGRNHPNAGETVVLAPVLDHVHLFDLESGERLSEKAVASA